MARLPRLSGRELVRVLGRAGFHPVRQKGSHVILVREGPEGRTGCVVPLHPEIETGTLSGILKQTGLSREEFLRLARR